MGAFCLIASSYQIGKVLNVRRKNLAPRANSIDSKSLVQIAVPHVLRRTQAIVASFLEKGHTASRSLEAERRSPANDAVRRLSEVTEVLSMMRKVAVFDFRCRAFSLSGVLY